MEKWGFGIFAAFFCGCFTTASRAQPPATQPTTTLITTTQPALINDLVFPPGKDRVEIPLRYCEHELLVDGVEINGKKLGALFGLPHE